MNRVTTTMSGERIQMTEKRLSRRITCVVGGALRCRDATFRCRLENISKAGALVTVSETPLSDIHAGDACLLRLYHEIEGRYIAVAAVIVHHAFAFIGVTFTGLDAETKASLETILEREERKALNVSYNAAHYSSYGAVERCSP